MQTNIYTLPSGTLLNNGGYRIERHLNSGGFGNTYLATNVHFEEQVAIKEFYMTDRCVRAADSTVTVSAPGAKQDYDHYLAKFKKEAQRMHRLQETHRHPNIVGVKDFFVERGTAYYVMDYIDGESLEQKVCRQGPLSQGEVLGYLTQLLSALEVVHSEGLCHFDIKPANMLVDGAGTLKLIDFGASKIADASSGHNTTTAVLGTPGYVPIEQAPGTKNFRPCTDYYAVGATVYRLLTGNTPPDAHRVLNEGDKAFEFSRVSGAMQKFIVAMMQPMSAKRPQNNAEVQELMRQLNLNASSDNTMVLPLEKQVKTRRVVTTDGDTMPLPPPFKGEKKGLLPSGKMKWAAAALAAVLAIAAVAMWASRGGDKDAAEEDKTALYENTAETTSDNAPSGIEAQKPAEPSAEPVGIKDIWDKSWKYTFPSNDGGDNLYKGKLEFSLYNNEYSNGMYGAHIGLSRWYEFDGRKGKAIVGVTLDCYYTVQDNVIKFKRHDGKPMLSSSLGDEADRYGKELSERHNALLRELDDMLFGDGIRIVKLEGNSLWLYVQGGSKEFKKSYDFSTKELIND